MSVVILGMEIPKSCESCGIPCELWIMHKVGQRHPDCPLRSLPKRHGALIDRDALLKQKGDCYDHDGHLLYAVGTGNILCAPTIVEAEGD